MRDGTSVTPILIWFGAGIALLVVFRLIENPFYAAMLMPAVALIYLGVAMVLLVAYVRSALKDSNRKSWTAAAAIPTLTAVLILIAPFVARLVTYAEFAMLLPTYSNSL